MDFTQFKYERIDLDKVKADVEAQLEIMDQATSVDELDLAIKSIYKIRN